MTDLDASIQGYSHIQPTIQKSECIIFFGADNFSDGLLTIEHSLPWFATLVPVHALDVLFQKARFQKLVLLLTNDGIDACDTNLPPTNTKFRCSSMMISLSTGNLAPNKVPCTDRWNTSKPKHWQSLCDTCDDSCVYTTWQAILLTHLWCFWRIRLAMGLKSPTKHYMVSRAAHWTQRSSHCIDRNHDSLFGLRSCQKHVTSHTISEKDLYTSMGIPLASWNKQPPSSHQIPPILSTSSGFMSVCDWQHRTLHLPGSLSQLQVHYYQTDATGAAYAFSGNYKIVHQP